MGLLLTLGGGAAHAVVTLAIDTVTGGLLSGNPLNFSLAPSGLAVDSAGNIFLADSTYSRIYKITPAGALTTVAGKGYQGYSGDGGPATEANLYSPYGHMVVDAGGNLYFSDISNNVVRKIAANGIISTVVGTGPGIYGYNGDGIAATAANLWTPRALALDAQGNLLIADSSNQRVRKVSPAGIISTVAGSGGTGFGGDGGLATQAQFNMVTALAVDAAGNIFVGDTSSTCVRKINTAGIISTYAGICGSRGLSGDGGPATSAQLSYLGGLSVDRSGNLFIADRGNSRVRMVDGNGTISTVAGSTSGFSGDGGAATAAQLNSPEDLFNDGAGNLLIADGSHLRRVDSNGIITTIAGNGRTSFSGDGGPLTQVQFNNMKGIAFDRQGNFYFSDAFNRRIRKFDQTSGRVSTIAGTGVRGFSGDGGPATAANLNMPTILTFDAVGNLYFVDNLRIRKIDTAGNISTLTGTGVAGYSGDGGPATAAQIPALESLVVASNGDVYLCDAYYQSSRVRKIDAVSGIISTVAGDGSGTSFGDGGPASAAGLKPKGLVFDVQGNLYITDANARIRKIDAVSGNISTIAGTGVAGYSGDGGLATAAQLNNPGHIMINGRKLIFADGNSLLRQVDLDSGIITTLAGTGSTGFSGDGGRASAAQLGWPTTPALGGDGLVYFVDSNYQHLRKLFYKEFVDPVSSVPSSPFVLPSVEVAAGGSGSARPGAVANLTGSGTITASDGSAINLVPRNSLEGASIVFKTDVPVSDGVHINFGQQNLTVRPQGSAALTVHQIGGAYLPVLTQGDAVLVAGAAGPLLGVIGRAANMFAAAGSVVEADTVNSRVAVRYDSASGETRLAVDEGIIKIGTRRLFAGEAVVFDSTGQAGDIYLGSLTNDVGLPGDPLRLSVREGVSVEANVPRLSGALSALNGSLDDAIGSALGSYLQLAVSAQDGSGQLRFADGQRQGSLLPIGKVAVQRDQADGIGVTDAGLLYVQNNGYRVTLAPMVSDLGALADLAQGTVTVQGDGVLRLTQGGATYALRPAWWGWSGSASRSLQQVSDTWNFQYGNGSQTLLPAFVAYPALKHAVQGLDSSAVLSTGNDGSVLVSRAGSSVTLRPQAPLQALPADHRNDIWWQSGESFYLATGDGKTAQGFSVR